MTGIPDELVWEALLGFGFGPGELECEAEMRAALTAIGLPALLEDNEQLRVSVNRDFGEPLDEVYKTDGITIVMQQIHDLRREKAALLERVEAAEREVEKRDEVLAAVAADARQWQRQWNADHMKPETFDQGVGAHAQDVLALLADLGTDGV